MIKDKLLTVLALFLCFFSSCADMHDPLLHMAGKVEIRPEVEQNVKIDMLWQTDWQSKWQVDWDTSLKGELGYTKPETFHYNYYSAESGKLVGQRDVASESTRLNLGYGDYKLFTYTKDYENLRVNTSDDYHIVTATTIPDNYSELPDSLTKKLTVYEMPDEIFSMYADVTISDKLEDYVYVPEENIYLLRINAELEPRVFIYLLQVELLNNKGRIKSSGIFTVSGLAKSVDLMTGQTGTESVAHQFSSVYQELDKQDSGGQASSKQASSPTRALSSEADALIGGRFTTFGRPTDSDEANMCYLAVKYKSGARVCIPFDITDQIKGLPKGGVINLQIDLDQVKVDTGGGGGWNINVGGWDESQTEQDI